MTVLGLGVQSVLNRTKAYSKSELGQGGEGKGRAAFPPAQQRIPSSNRDNQSQPLAFILRCEPRIASGDDL